ncbi:uncharacterized protein LOC143677838 [Tamandua tetradactyla]|uniref:uncharacterized protein LOC143677838 n=1 Tax=Tamandua tetradactyla TaxID=48850 RepID=UPI0040547B11
MREGAGPGPASPAVTCFSGKQMLALAKGGLRSMKGSSVAWAARSTSRGARVLSQPRLGASQAWTYSPSGISDRGLRRGPRNYSALGSSAVRAEGRRSLIGLAARRSSRRPKGTTFPFHPHRRRGSRFTTRPPEGSLGTRVLARGWSCPGLTGGRLEKALSERDAIKMLRRRPERKTRPSQISWACGIILIKKETSKQNSR